jgi:hypothetical protein
MMTLRALAASVTLVAAMFAGTPATRGAVDTIYLGGNPTVSGGSCADPDFSTAGGYDAAMASALAAIDADGDTIVMCNGTYATSTTETIEVDYTFTIRAETRRGVTIGGTDAFLEICAPDFTLRGLRFFELFGPVIELSGGLGIDCESADATIQDVEVSSSEVLAFAGFFEVGTGVLRVVDSHVHDNSEFVIAAWPSIHVENSVFERNFSFITLFAPFALSIHGSTFEENGSLWASVGATSCLTVDKSAFKENGPFDPFDLMGEDMSFTTLLVGPFFGGEGSCGSKIQRSLFEGNTALTAGALTMVDPEASTVVKGNTFVGNRGELAGAVAVCSESSSRKLQALAKRIGFFKINRFRNNEAEDRRSNNTAFVVGDCASFGGG